MRHLTRREAVLAASFTILVAIPLLWLPGCGPVVTSTATAGEGSMDSPSSFAIRGDVSRAISPGQWVALDLTLDNTNDSDVVIDRITVAVVGIEAPRSDADHPCSTADFGVRQLSGEVPLRLPGNSTITLSGRDVPEENRPAVGMINRPVNQDGCKGASLTLSYEASGMEVPG